MDNFNGGAWLSSAVENPLGVPRFCGVLYLVIQPAEPADILTILPNDLNWSRKRWEDEKIYIENASTISITTPLCNANHFFASLVENHVWPSEPDGVAFQGVPGFVSCDAKSKYFIQKFKLYFELVFNKGSILIFPFLSFTRNRLQSKVWNPNWAGSIWVAAQLGPTLAAEILSVSRFIWFPFSLSNFIWFPLWNLNQAGSIVVAAWSHLGSWDVISVSSTATQVT